MDVSVITTGSSTSGTSATRSSTIAQLRARIQSVQQQIAQLEANQTFDADTKEQRLTALEAQLRQLQSQLARVQQAQSGANTSGESTTDAPAASSETVGTRFSAFA